MASVKQARDILAADLEDSRSAHRQVLERMTAKKAEHTEEMRQMKTTISALQGALANHAKEVAQLTALKQKYEEALDSKPVVPRDMRQVMDENAFLKKELENAKSRLADSTAECATVKQGAKTSEASLNNQLQQAKSNAEKQQKRAKDLDKRLQSDAEAADKVGATTALSFYF